MKKNWWLHPFLLGLFPVIFLYFQNTHLITVGDLLRPSAAITISIILLLSFLILTVKPKAKAAALLSLWLILFFAYGHIHNFLPDLRWHIGSYVLYPNTVLLPIWALSGMILSFLIIRKKSNYNSLTNFFNIAAIILISTSLITGIPKLILETESETSHIIAESTLTIPDTPPDIYYLIIDGYAGNDILSEVFNHDNSSFTNSLNDRGFFVADKSRSNYCQTILSLSSSLNMEYVETLTSTIDIKSSGRKELIFRLKHNELKNQLQAIGYKFAAYSSGYSGTEITNADIFIEPARTLSEFEQILLGTTPIPVLIRKLKSTDMHRDRILYNLDQLPTRPKIDQPLFTFMHLVCPHPPFIFDSDGRDITGANVQVFTHGKNGAWFKTDDTEQKYIEQIKFLNKRLIEIVDKIIANSSTPPIIVIQADHGSLFPRDINEIKKLFYKEKFSILNALYLPGVDTALVPNDLAPVNIFRLIFNSYFGADYQYLENRSYFSIWKKPFEFTEVSEEVK